MCVLLSLLKASRDELFSLPPSIFFFVSVHYGRLAVRQQKVCVQSIGMYTCRHVLHSTEGICRVRVPCCHVLYSCRRHAHRLMGGAKDFLSSAPLYCSTYFK
ncbi:unnamed protein product [Discosporangium mesarthrocarpum]